MDVVKQNVEKIGGSVAIRTKQGQGTAIIIRIPLTMAIIQALIVRCGQQKMAVPVAAVQETFRVMRDEISSVDGNELISVRQDTLPFVRLSKVFQGTGADPDPDKLFAVRVHQADLDICLGVDALLGQEEIVIKPLADYLTDKPGFSGATVLGDGSIALIIDIAAMIERARKMAVGRDTDGTLKTLH
jgi:two-component system chemotaxis sensor kinase CheA